MPKYESRPKRWARLVSEAQDALEMLQNAFTPLAELRSQYEFWQDNLPDNLRESPVNDKLQAIVDLDLESCLYEVQDVINEAKSCELPLGFGRD